jgi:Tfp pilus assembly protein PilF
MDVAARLDLAAAYAGSGDDRDAAEQYVIVARLDPRNVEAHTGLAMIADRAGRPQDALTLLDQALAIDPRAPEALYDRGIVLLRGLGRAREAAASFRAYLAAAPFGAHRQEVQALLAAASAPGASATPSPAASPSPTG